MSFGAIFALKKSSLGSIIPFVLIANDVHFQRQVVSSVSMIKKIDEDLHLLIALCWEIF